MFNDVELAIPDTKELVESLKLYAECRRRDILLRGQSPPDCWRIGENYRVMLHLPYKIKQLQARLRAASESAGVELVELAGHFDTERPDAIMEAHRAAKRLLARIQPKKRTMTGKRVKDKPLTDRQKSRGRI